MDAANVRDASSLVTADRRFAYAPMYRDGETFGGIGLASLGGAGLRRACLPFLVVVSALLETQLNNRVNAVAGCIRLPP